MKSWLEWLFYSCWNGDKKELFERTCEEICKPFHKTPNGASYLNKCIVYGIVSTTVLLESLVLVQTWRTEWRCISSNYIWKNFFSVKYMINFSDMTLFSHFQIVLNLSLFKSLKTFKLTPFCLFSNSKFKTMLYKLGEFFFVPLLNSTKQNIDSDL